MLSANLATGRIGETLAIAHLRRLRYRILHKNYRFKAVEIDIIAQHLGVIHFIEVKTRRSVRYGKPYEAVTAQKVRHLLRAVEFYLLQSKKKKSRLSLDVISIVLDERNKPVSIDHYKNINS